MIRLDRSFDGLEPLQRAVLTLQAASDDSELDTLYETAPIECYGKRHHTEATNGLAWMGQIYRNRQLEAVVTRQTLEVMTLQEDLAHAYVGSENAEKYITGLKAEQLTEQCNVRRHYARDEYEQKLEWSKLVLAWGYVAELEGFEMWCQSYGCGRYDLCRSMADEGQDTLEIMDTTMSSIAPSAEEMPEIARIFGVEWPERPNTAERRRDGYETFFNRVYSGPRGVEL